MLMGFAIYLFAAALLWADAAQAGFLVPIIGGAAFAATAAGSILTFGLNLVAGFGLSWAYAKLFAQKPQQQTGGVQLSVRVDAETPMSLLVGRATTAGSLAYVKTYGVRGETANSDMIEVIGIADHPCGQLLKVYVEGKEAELQAPSGDRGQVVEGYNDKLALKYFDGAQTAADPFAVDKLGAAETNPWTAAHVGHGVAYARIHSIYSQKVSGRLNWRFVVEGIRLYDPRKDSTIGGSGAHRFDDLDTHEFSSNLAVIAYNVLRGVRVKNASGQPIHFYGLEGTKAEQLPLDSWFAAMNECEIAVDRGDGVMEPQYHGGGEIPVNTEPMEAIKELLKSCGGRIVESGGVYKLVIGAPALPVLSISDESLLANREETHHPILPLEKRVNYVTGSYTSPADNWSTKVAPPRSDAEWEAEDGRRLAADLPLPMVQSARQMQQLQLQYLNRARRQRTHAIALPPTAFVLEPGDTISWSSARNGYVDKLFEVDSVDYETNLNVGLALTETDPADYDWQVEFQLPEIDGRLTSLYPSAKPIGGFGAQGLVYSGDPGTKRPAIRLYWDDPEDEDLVAVVWQIRRAADPSNVALGRSDDAAALEAIILGGLQASTSYQVRGRFESQSGYAAEWSLWLDVTTPDARFSTADFEAGLADYVTNELSAAFEQIRAMAQLIASYAADQDAANWTDKKQVRQDLVAREAVLSASISEVQTVAASTQAAFADYQLEVSASFGAVNSAVSVQAAALVTINGQLANTWQVTLDGNGYVSGIKAFNDGTTSAIVMVADIFQVAFPGQAGGAPAPVWQIANVDGVSKIALRGDMVADGTITARSLNVGTLEAITGNVGTLSAGVIRDPNSKTIFDLNTGTLVGYD